MKNIIFHRFLLTLLACVLLCVYSGSSCLAEDRTDSDRTQSTVDSKPAGVESDKTISWLSYEDALDRAKTENKKILIYFYTNRCPYCKVMETKTLSDQRVIDLLNDKFCCAKVNLDSKPAMRVMYPVSGVPTSWFLESSGKKIGGRPGFVPPEMFVETLQVVIDEKYK